jgi:hypothetical protein
VRLHRVRPALQPADRRAAADDARRGGAAATGSAACCARPSPSRGTPRGRATRCFERASEMMFVDAARRYSTRFPTRRPGGSGLRDRHVGRASACSTRSLRAVDARRALAPRRVVPLGAARPLHALRRHGPMQYLARWRMQLRGGGCAPATRRSPRSRSTSATSPGGVLAPSSALRGARRRGDARRPAAIARGGRSRADAAPDAYREKRPSDATITVSTNVEPVCAPGR